MHKDCLVPTYYETRDGYQLGTWVTNLRRRRSDLPVEKIAQLDALGFEWRSRHGTQWEAGYAEEIVAKLRQVDVLVSQGQNMVDAIRQIGVSAWTDSGWRQDFG